MPLARLCRLLLAVPVLLALAACAGQEARPVGGPGQSMDDLPPMKQFPLRAAAPPTRSNADMARDFLDLGFLMESGQPVPRLSRFQGPIGISVQPGAPPTLGPDLDDLIIRLRQEAGIDIRRLPDGSPAQIVILTPTRAQMKSEVPEAACFVVPNVDSWDAFVRLRSSRVTDWGALTERRQAAVFLPREASPQEIRDCLHEEVAQALGPLNDLFRLPDSVFNDDNFQTVLTGFDMLMLRAWYAPAMAGSPTREQAAEALPRLLAELNPAGQRRVSEGLPITTRNWIDAIKSALGPRGNEAWRRRQASRALAIAQQEGWQDTRLGFSYYVVGRLAIGYDVEGAFEAFIRAHRVYRNLLGTDSVQTATVAMQLAAFALIADEPEVALDLVAESLPPARESQNAVLLATLLFMRSEALAQQGRLKEAAAVRTESLAWARYGFGSAETADLNTIPPVDLTAAATEAGL